MDFFEKMLRLVVENEDGPIKDHGFIPLIFHALSDEEIFLRRLCPKFAKKVTFSRNVNFQLSKLPLETYFFV